MNTNRHALVVGLGIAGMSAAIGLRSAGWEVTIVERAPGRRSGGYFVGLFTEGKEGAEQLGVLPHLHTRNPVGANGWHIDSQGQRKAGLGFLDQPGGPYAVMRGDIEAALWARLGDAELRNDDGTAVRVRFGTRPLTIAQNAREVEVTLEDTTAGETTVERFDLVVGADGLRSTIRRLAFGPHEDYMKSWDAIICAFEFSEQVPGFAVDDSITLAPPRRASWVFAFSDRTPTALLTYRTSDIDAQFRQAPLETLKQVYAGMDHHPVVQHSLAQLETAEHFLFDSVHSVHMPHWHDGRVVLLGDSAWCLTLYSGMGSSAGLRGGAELATALTEHPEDLDAALRAYERKMRPFITASARRAKIIQHMFVPGGRVSASIRDTVLGAAGHLAAHSRRRAQAKADRAAPADAARPGGAY